MSVIQMVPFITTLDSKHCFVFKFNFTQQKNIVVFIRLYLHCVKIYQLNIFAALHKIRLHNSGHCK